MAVSEKTKNLNNIIQDAYSIWIKCCSDVYSDSGWQNVMNGIERLECGINCEEINVSAGKYYNYFSDSFDKIPYREYSLQIVTRYGNIDGIICCHSAGTIEDPFSKYDMTISLWRHEETDKINESLFDDDFFEDIHNMANSMMNTPLARKFKEEISGSKTLQQVKTIAKKYVKRGLNFTLAMTLIAMEITISVAGRRELMKELASENSRIEQSIVNEVEPMWQELASDVQATVYNAVPSQCNDDIAHTASMFELNLNRVGEHKIIAMERSMMQQYGLKYGSLVKIEGAGKYDGVYQIQDTMNKRFKGKHKIDILVDNNTHLGMWDNVKIYTLMNGSECADTLKDTMLDAINQQKIDARQKYLYEI